MYRYCFAVFAFFASLREQQMFGDRFQVCQFSALFMHCCTSVLNSSWPCYGFMLSSPRAQSYIIRLHDYVIKTVSLRLYHSHLTSSSTLILVLWKRIICWTCSLHRRARQPTPWISSHGHAAQCKGPISPPIFSGFPFFFVSRVEKWQGHFFLSD